MASIARFIAGAGALAGGYIQGKKMADDQAYEREKRDRERAEYADKQAVKDRLKAINGMDATQSLSGEDAYNTGMDAYNQAAAGAATDEQKAEVARNYTPTLQALQDQRATPAQYVLNGKTFSDKPTADQIAGERRSATIQALGTIDPERAMSYEANSLTLDDKKRDAAYKAGWAGMWKDTPWGQAIAEKRTPSPAEQLQSSMTSLAYQAQHGQASPEHLMSAAEKMKAINDESYFKTAVALNAGASKEKLAQTFSATGQKIDPSQLSEPRPVEVDVGGGQKVKTYEVTVTDANGNQRTINGYRELDALGKAHEAFQRAIETTKMGYEGRKTAATEETAKAATLGAQAHGASAAASGILASVAQGKETRATTREDAVSKGVADYADAEARGDEKGMNAARRSILTNGGKLDKPEVVKPEVKVGQIGDITVSQPTGKGGVQVTNYGPDMKQKGSVSVPAPGTAQVAPVAAPKSKADFDKLPAGTVYIDPEDGKKYRKP